MVSGAPCLARYKQGFAADRVNFFFFFALSAGTIRSMLEGEYREAKDGVITFRDISGAVLERVVQYFYFKHRYTNTIEDIPTFPIDPEYALELLMAANFLDT